MFQTKNLLDVRYFHVLDDRIVRRISHIQKLTTQWEYSVIVSADHAQTRDRKCFGGVSFSEDKGTLVSLSSSSVVGVF